MTSSLHCVGIVFGVFLFFLSFLSPVAGVTYLWDLLKPALTAVEAQEILLHARPGESYPTLAEIPVTSFDCLQHKYAGFYADVATRCQVFHRCEINGRQTTYLCLNATIFNQLTLICDHFYNVQCSRSEEYADFSNSRLYTNQPLFDSPPVGYVSKQTPSTGALSSGKKEVQKSVVKTEKPRLNSGNSSMISAFSGESQASSSLQTSQLPSVKSSNRPIVNIVLPQETVTEMTTVARCTGSICEEPRKRGRKRGRRKNFPSLSSKGQA